MGVIAETAVRVRADTAGFQGEAHRGVMGSITRVAGAAAAALGGLAIGKALFVDPIKQAGNFEQSLNVLQATSHATDGAMKQISATAMKLGNDTKLPAVSATDAANAMLELAKGGFSAKESMEGARGVLLLSTAAQIDGAQAATLVADSIHAFGLRAKDAGMVVNDFAGAANASTASMDQVGQALQQSGQAFHTLGIPIGDATTAIAALANAGIKGSDAGTSLKTMLQRLNPTTAAAKKEMQEMGVHTFDAQGKFVGMRSVIEQMGPKLRSMSQEQRQAALNTIFGSDASRAAGIILGQTTAQWDKQHAAVTKAGQAQALADAQTKGFKGAMAGLRSTIETLQLQIGLKMLPVLTTFVRFLSANLPAAVSAAGAALGAIGDAIRGVADWLGVFQEKAADDHGLNGLANGLDTTRTRFETFMEIVRNVASVVGPILRGAFDTARAAIQTTISVVSEIVGWLNQNRDVAAALAAFVATLAAGYLAYQAALLVTRAALAVATAAQWLLNAAMTANPIGIVVVAIAALVAGLIILYQRSETARTIMNGAFNAIRAAADAVFGYMTNTLIPAAIAAWNRFGPGVVAALTSAASTIRTIVQGIATVVETIVDQIEAHWRQVWAILGPSTRAYLEVVRTVVTTVLNVIAGVVRVFAALLRGDWSAAWNALKGIVSDVLNGVVSVVGSILRGLAGTARALANAIGTAIAAGVKTAAAKLAGLAGDITGRIAAAISQVAGWAYGQALSIGASIASGVVDGVGDLAGALKNKVTGAIGGALGGIGGFIRKGSPSGLFRDEIGVPIGEGIVVGAAMALDRLSPTLLPKIRSTADALRGATAAEGKKIAEAFGKWATDSKAEYDRKAGLILASVEAQFSKAQAALEKWKAKLTPAEAQIQAAQARAAAVSAQAAVDKAWLDLKALPAAQQAAFNTLLAQQRANMASLQATLISSRDDAILAENTFNQGSAAAAGNPFAGILLGAQQTFNVTKQQFDQGIVDQAAFIAAANALSAAKLQAQQAIDAASAGSTEVTEAQKTAAAQAQQAQRLLDDYITWQTLGVQQTAAGAAITAQQAADAEAQTALQATHNQQTIDATTTKDNALQGLLDYNLGIVAGRERAARDAEAVSLNTALVKRHDRYITHFENVKKIHDNAYDALLKMADTSGKQTGNQLAIALESMIPRIGRAAQAVANELKKYLKLASPSERGPLSDLDRWWTPLAETLASGVDTRELGRTVTGFVTPPSAAIGGRDQRGLNLSASPQDRYNRERTLYLLDQIAKHTGTTANQKPPAVPEIHVSGGVAIDASVYRSKR